MNEFWHFDVFWIFVIIEVFKNVTLSWLQTTYISLFLCHVQSYQLGLIINCDN